MRKSDSLKDYGASCFFRRQSGSDRPFCSIQSRPSQYEITPDICAQCPIPAQPCQYLDAKVIIAPGLDDRPIPRVLYATCRRREVRINEVTFVECRGCPENVPATPPGEDLDLEGMRIDNLTGLLRREHFDKNLEEMVLKTRSMGGGLTLILADIDHFKRINDTFGHLQGDSVLRTIGRITKTLVGERGLACRYGGEEIALILPRREKKEAAAIGEKFRRTVELHLFKRIDKEGEIIPVTLSAGISLFPSLARDPVELIRQADQALYRAKESGRNRVVLYDPKRDTEEVPVLLNVTFHGFPEISNSGKISLDRWKLGDEGSLEELVGLDLFDHQRGVRSISEDANPEMAGAFAHPIEGTAREIVRQGSLTRFRLALRPRAHQELEKAVRRGQGVRKG